MIKLIVNADDFGYSNGINYGIIDAHKNGIVNSATLMMNMPGTAHAIELAKQTPTLGVGIHLVLDCEKPLRNDVPSLINESGYFKHRKQIINNPAIDLADVEKEWRTQIDVCYAAGLTPTHLDSHHHIHGAPNLIPVIEKLSQVYKLPVRTDMNDTLKNALPFSDYCFFDFYEDGVTMDYFEKLAKKVPDGSIVEIMAHPGYLDSIITNGSSYTMKRVEEYHVLTTCTLPNIFELVSFHS
jgi:chitin disaccharide deacetylase